MGDPAGDGQIQLPCRRKGSRSDSIGARLDESFRVGESSSGVGFGDAFLFPKEDLAYALAATSEVCLLNPCNVVAQLVTSQLVAVDTTMTFM